MIFSKPDSRLKMRIWDQLFRRISRDCAGEHFYDLDNYLKRALLFSLCNMHPVNRVHGLSVPTLQAHLQDDTRVRKHHPHGIEDRKTLP